MADQKSKSARAVAVQVLNRCDPEKNYAGPVLEKLLGRTYMPWVLGAIAVGSLATVVHRLVHVVRQTRNK